MFIKMLIGAAALVVAVPAFAQQTTPAQDKPAPAAAATPAPVPQAEPTPAPATDGAKVEQAPADAAKAEEKKDKPKR